MPSPFPGMDPYLENPALWPNVHHGLISELQAELNRQLLPRYLATVEERVYLSDEEDAGRDFVVPDVHLVVQDQRTKWRPNITGGIAVIEPVEVSPIVEDEVHEARIELTDLQERRLVTVIEILSPTNKLAGSNGRKSYLQKRQEVMRSSSHFVEIDLLRGGLRMRVLETLPPYDYLVHISRVGEEFRGSKVWPIPIRLPLPEIPIPLKKEDGHAAIALQTILTNAISRGGYDRKADYTRDPVPPLTIEQAEWARQVIAAAKPA